MNIWRNRTHRKIENKVDMHTRVNKSMEMIQKVFLGIAFRSLYQMNCAVI